MRRVVATSLDVSIGGLTLLVVALGLLPGSVGAQSFTVGPVGSSAYVINGQNNPGLTLTRGQTYTFSVNAAGHPFWIKFVKSTGKANAFNDGVTNNGVQVGTLTFAVPLNAPGTLFYNCEIHAAMTGRITVVDEGPSPTATDTPSITPTQTPLPTSTPTATVIPVQCVGDCRDDGEVTVDDILVMVNIALGTAPITECSAGDGNADGQIAVDDILAAVNNALSGCR